MEMEKDMVYMSFNFFVSKTPLKFNKTCEIQLLFSCVWIPEWKWGGTPLTQTTTT